MLKKLRLKFILISMASILFVLFLTIGSINIANYASIENSSNDILTEIIKEGTDDIGPGPGGGDNDPGHINLRQEHYFIVSINNDGTVNKINNRHMFILSEEECKDLALKVYSNELSGGKYNDLRYRKETKSDGLTYVGFLDLKERFDSFNNFLLLSSTISIGAFVIISGLIFFASKIAFKSSEEAYKKQKRFITNASHELKTPLTIISADIDLLEMDHGKNEWSESIKDQVKRLTDMTNNLVTLSKLEEEDASRFPFADFSINEVANKAIDAFKNNFKKENIKFGHNITGNLTMYGNKYLIDELIYIFLDNSLKYTGGEIKSSYFVISKNNKGKIEFRFSNTLSKDYEIDPDQILERFYRSPSTKKEGSGIGLSVAEEIVTLHKGKIKVDKSNNSITFIITFN